MKLEELVNFEKGCLFETLTTTLFKLTFVSPEREDLETVSKIIEDIGETDNDEAITILLNDLKEIKSSLTEYFENNGEDEKYYSKVINLGQDLATVL